MMSPLDTAKKADFHQSHITPTSNGQERVVDLWARSGGWSVLDEAVEQRGKTSVGLWSKCRRFDATRCWVTRLGRAQNTAPVKDDGFYFANAPIRFATVIAAV